MENKANKDSWQTPSWLYDELNEEFKFDIDLCATRENSKCDAFCTDYLRNQIIIFENNRDDIYYSKLDWYDYNSAFMNPPYSNPYPFVEKAWEDSKHCKIVCVLPTKTDTKWWRIFYACGVKCMNCRGLGRAYEGDHHRDCRDCSGTGAYHGTKDGCEIRFMPYRTHHKSRVAFINPETGKERRGNPCGTCIVIMDRREL